MRVLLVALSMLTVVLAGCLGSEDGFEMREGPDVLPVGTGGFRTLGLDVEPVDITADLVEGRPWYKHTGFSGAEPTMAITSNGALFAAAGNAGIRSLDGGETWEEVIRVGLDSGTPVDSVYRSWDPMMWYDKWTDIVYFDPMFPPLACTELSWSDDHGETWTRNPPACHPPPMDHQKLFSGPAGPIANPLAGPHESVLYQCYNQIMSTSCGISYDNGMTWPVTSVVADRVTTRCGGTNGHGVVSEKGVAVVPVSSCDELGLGFSTDSGLTWSFMKAPGGLGVTSFDPDLVFDETETLYVLWRGDDRITYLLRTPDYGETWEGPFRVTPPHVQSTFFHTMNAGDDGRLAMSFLGTKTHAGDPNEAPTGTLWDLYFVTTEDRDADEPEFVFYQVTPDEDPMHVGQICTDGALCTTGRELLEFIDSAVSPGGIFHVIYTESCGPKCSAKSDRTEEDKDGRHVSIARLDDWHLWAGEPAPAMVAP